MSVCHCDCGEGSHVTITYDALGLTIHGTSQPQTPFCTWILLQGNLFTLGPPQCRHLVAGYWWDGGRYASYWNAFLFCFGKKKTEGLINMLKSILSNCTYQEERTRKIRVIRDKRVEPGAAYFQGTLSFAILTQYTISYYVNTTAGQCTR